MDTWTFHPYVIAEHCRFNSLRPSGETFHKILEPFRRNLLSFSHKRASVRLGTGVWCSSSSWKGWTGLRSLLCGHKTSLCVVSLRFFLFVNKGAKTMKSNPSQGCQHTSGHMQLIILPVHQRANITVTLIHTNKVYLIPILRLWKKTQDETNTGRIKSRFLCVFVTVITTCIILHLYIQ